jgi:hypothetical protein
MKLGRRSALDDALLLGAPLITLILLVTYVGRHEFAVDFQHQYWVVGHRLLTSGSPYAWTHAQIASGVGAFPYPALSALLFVPFALLPETAAAVLWVAIQMSAVLATLRVLSIRDRRVYALAFLWWPVIIGWQSGNMTLLLALLIALVWRYRDQPILSGVLTALLISLKPFLWPIGLWLLVTRRYRSAAWALGGGLVLNLIAWGVVGFDQLSRYLHLDSEVTSALYRYGYGVIAIAVRLGAGRSAGTVAMFVVAAGLAALCIWFGSRRREDFALLICVDLTLAASPLLWTHYLGLLLVPLAILRPRLSIEWLLPLLIWLCPGGLQESAWQVALFALITATLTYLLLKRRPPAEDLTPELVVSDQRRSGQAHVLATAQGGERAG